MNKYILGALALLTGFGIASCDSGSSDDTQKAESAMHIRKFITSVPVNATLVKFGRLLPWDIVRISDGTIYVANGLDYPVLKIAQNGAVSEMNVKAVHVARDEKDNVYFRVASGITELQKNGILIELIGNATTNPSVLGYWSSQITADGSGNIYISGGYSDGKYTAMKLGIDHQLTTLFSLPLSSDHIITHIPIQLNNFASDSQGNLYFGTERNIFKVDKFNKISSLAGDETRVAKRFDLPIDGVGLDATFSFIQFMKVDHHGNIYVRSGRDSVRMITPKGLVKTILVNGCNYQPPAHVSEMGCSMDFVDGNLKKQNLLINIDVFDVDDDGDIYYVDSMANAIRKVTPDGQLSTIVRGELPQSMWNLSQ